MNHTKDNCSAWNLILSSCGTQCGNCLACTCGECRYAGLSPADRRAEETRAMNEEIKLAERRHQTMQHQYSYPHFEVAAIRQKYGRN